MIDPDVKAIAEFMQSQIEARKLLGVAESLRAIAPILWGHYDRTTFPAIELVAAPISESHGSRSIASESEQMGVRVDGDSARLPDKFLAQATRNCRFHK